MRTLLGLIGKKVGMTRMFDSNGNVVPVTLIKAGPCVITDVRTIERNGYEAVQLGFEEIKDYRVTKPVREAFKKKGVQCFRILREFPVRGAGETYKVGDAVTAEIFEKIAAIKVSGRSKGCGFSGGVKQWGFRGAPGSHGTSKVHRKPMSAGATDAARVFKGKRSPGRMGNENVTVRNLKVMKVDAGSNLVAVKGAIPGKRNSIVLLTQEK
ncbi:MAG: 50S ribosomal protein L3 [bacterium]